MNTEDTRMAVGGPLKAWTAQIRGGRGGSLDLVPNEFGGVDGEELEAGVRDC
jgi:hypothetical protein